MRLVRQWASCHGCLLPQISVYQCYFVQLLFLSSLIVCLDHKLGCSLSFILGVLSTFVLPQHCIPLFLIQINTISQMEIIIQHFPPKTSKHSANKNIPQYPSCGVYYYPPFTRGETEEERGSETCPKSQRVSIRAETGTSIPLTLVRQRNWTEVETPSFPTLYHSQLPSAFLLALGSEALFMLCYICKEHSYSTFPNRHCSAPEGLLKLIFITSA